jgi:hypothetical protein
MTTAQWLGAASRATGRSFFCRTLGGCSNAPVGATIKAVQLPPRRFDCGVAGAALLSAGSPMLHFQVVTDAEVRVMRQMRFDGASYDHLAKRFKIHKKTVERLCRGFDRRNAGGVIEDSPGRQSGDHPYDPQRYERWPNCGVPVHPPCLKCEVDAQRRRPKKKSASCQRAPGDHRRALHFRRPRKEFQSPTFIDPLYC